MQILRKAYSPPKTRVTKVSERLLTQFASQVEFFLGHFLLRVLSLWRSKFSHFLMALGLVATEFSTRKLLILKTNFLIKAFVPTVTQVPQLAYFTGLSSIISWGWILIWVFVFVLTFGNFPYVFTKSVIKLKLCLL